MLSRRSVCWGGSGTCINTSAFSSLRGPTSISTMALFSDCMRNCVAFHAFLRIRAGTRGLLRDKTPVHRPGVRSNSFPKKYLPACLSHLPICRSRVATEEKKGARLLLLCPAAPDTGTCQSTRTVALSFSTRFDRKQTPERTRQGSRRRRGIVRRAGPRVLAAGERLRGGGVLLSSRFRGKT